jgi:hypothetical protein
MVEAVFVKQVNFVRSDGFGGTITADFNVKQLLSNMPVHLVSYPD